MLILISIPIFIYIFLTNKTIEKKITNSKIIIANKYREIIISLFIIIIYSKLTTFFIEKSFFNFLFFYFMFYRVVILLFRLQVLRILYFFRITNFFSYKLFFYKKFGLEFFKKLCFCEFKLKKIYILLSPVLIYFFDCDIYNYINIIIYSSFKKSDFDYVFDKFSSSNEIILTKNGIIKLEQYQCYIISNILDNKSQLKKQKFFWGKDFFYIDEKFNEIKKTELNLK